MKLFKKLSVLLFLGLLLNSCDKKDETAIEEQKSLVERLEDEKGLSQVELGEQLENPYSIESMNKALQSLRKSKRAQAKGLSDDFVIPTTHKYIRFKPKNEEELNILLNDSTLVLYEYPLDYEINIEGESYHDPELPIETPTYQYTAVEIDQELPENIEFELLANLFLPDEDEEDEEDNIESKGTSILSESAVDLLVEEALRITNNLVDEIEEGEKGIEAKTEGWFSRRRKWRPAGRIRMWDTEVGGFVGVRGIKVRVRRWFRVTRAFTDANGNFSCGGRFRGKARYRMDWERYHFALRSGFWASAQKRGPYTKSNWNWDIRNGDRHQYYATIFRAAYHYYYEDIQGLRRPPLNSFWRSQVRILASRRRDNDRLANHWEWRRVWGLGDQIIMNSFGYSTPQIYATTIHELAHASHWQMSKWAFQKTETKVAESWARGVQWVLTRMEYPNYLGREFSTGDYTLVVSDLIDNDFRTRLARTNRGFYREEEDQVSGYTIRQIEDALKGQRRWNNWRDNIRNRYTNGTEANLNRLFLSYE